MILELLIKPVTGTKKLFNVINKNLLIGISIGIPLVISLIIALMAKQVASIFMESNPFISYFLSPDGNMDSEIFIFAFKRGLTGIILLTALIFAFLVCYYNFRKVQVTPKYIWKSMMVSAIQIVYYLLLGGILSFLSIYFIVIIPIGIANSIICLYDIMAKEISVVEEMVKTTFEEAASSINVTADILDIKGDINSPSGNFNAENVQATPGISLPEKIKKLDSKQKKVTALVASIFVVFIVLISVGNYSSSKENVSKKLSNAIKNNNAKEIAKYIVASDSTLKINQENLTGFVEYLKESPSYTAALLSRIGAEASPNSKSKVFDVYGNEELIKLTTKGKKYLLFKNYVYEIPTYFIKIHTDYKNTEVTLNDKVLYTAAEDDSYKECGSYLPGKYEFKAKIKTEYAEASGNKKVVVSPDVMASKEISTHLALDGYKVDIFSDFEDAKIIVNGKDTGITVKNISSLIPLPNDGSCKIQLQNKFPWGDLKTTEEVVGKDDLRFEFGNKNTDFFNTIQPVIAEFLKSYSSAYNSLDAAKFTNVSDSFKKTLESNISSEKIFGKPLTGSIKTAKGDIASLRLEQGGYTNTGSYKATINVQLDGDLSRGGTKEFNNAIKTIDFIYDVNSKKWVVDDMHSNWWFVEQIKDGIDIKLN